MSAAPITAPSSWYRDPDRWPRERLGVFARAWQFVTHESALAETGSYVAETLAGYPLLLVRDDAGVVRGFHNACRHRAGPLVNQPAGRCEGMLTCQYHGWRYALDGRLRAARDFGPAADFDVREYGLFPVRVDSWRGLWFAAIEEPAHSLAQLMAPLDARLGHANWSDLKIGLRREHLLQCNWKTYVENYLEGYHVPAMHPSLDAEILADQYKVRIEGKVAIHDVPMRTPDPVYDGLWGWVWPNIGVNVYRSGLMLERMSPIGHAQTRLDYFYLTPGGEAPDPATMIMSDQVTAEDKWITERVQENLNAGIYAVGRLSPKHEGAVAAFQDWLREALQSSNSTAAATS